jgi:hypothetical protein
VPGRTYGLKGGICSHAAPGTPKLAYHEASGSVSALQSAAAGSEVPRLSNSSWRSPRKHE